MKKFYLVEIVSMYPKALFDTFADSMLLEDAWRNWKIRHIAVYTDIEAEALYSWLQDNCKKAAALAVFPFDPLNTQLGTRKRALQDWAKARMFDERKELENDVIYLKGSDYVELTGADIVTIEGERYRAVPESGEMSRCSGCDLEYCERLCESAPACRGIIFKKL